MKTMPNVEELAKGNPAIDLRLLAEFERLAPEPASVGEGAAYSLGTPIDEPAQQISSTGQSRNSSIERFLVLQLSE